MKTFNEIKEQQLWESLLSNYFRCKENNTLEERPQIFVFAENISGSIRVSFCDLKSITLPITITGSLHAIGCDLHSFTLPTGVNIIK